jgi:hypothetical protein
LLGTIISAAKEYRKEALVACSFALALVWQEFDAFHTQYILAQTETARTVPAKIVWTSVYLRRYFRDYMDAEIEYTQVDHGSSRRCRNLIEIEWEWTKYRRGDTIEIVPAETPCGKPVARNAMVPPAITHYESFATVVFGLLLGGIWLALERTRSAA